MDNRDVIKKLNDLYFIQRNHYLIQYKDGYKQYTKGQMNKAGTRKYSALMNWQFEKHLIGEFTIGTFANYYSKFMSFDVDFYNPKMAKWITYKVVNALDELGIKHYYISYSGGKGYHIDLFFSDLIRVDHAEKFFEQVILHADILPHSDESNKVEFRVTDGQGIKIPLGIHQKTGNYCGFCKVENGLKVIGKKRSQEYLFSIKKMKHKIILDIINVKYEETTKKKTLINTEEAISQHKPLPNYSMSEDCSIDLAINMLQNGLQVQGSRNKSLFLIGLYLKYMGLDEEKCRDELYTWMEWQNPNTYTTPLKDCYKEIDNTVRNMYEKNYNLSVKVKDLTVTYDEIKWIIDNCPEKNQKLIAYSMLIHSKRHANKQGVFYMTFKDIETATGLDDNTAERQVNKLINLNVIEVIARNQKQKGTVKKKANLYRISPITVENESVDQTSKEEFIPNKKNDFEVCLRFFFSNKELKKYLPRRQYESLVV